MYRHLQRRIRTAGQALRSRLPRKRSVPYRARFRDGLQFLSSEPATFFADSSRLAELAHALRTSTSPWVARALERVGNDRTVGLNVYSRRAPALDKSFPWGGVERGPGDDVLYAVRPHRFAFAPRFGLAILYEALPPDVFSEILESWIAFAKSGTSAYPYLSTLVVIQRSLALSWAYAFVSASSTSKGSAGMRLRLLILRVLRADIDFLLPRLGTGYPNNHLLVERFAAWYFSVVFPEMVSPARNPADLEKEFTDELLRQTYPDGGGFEHSLHYHEFGCEMAAAYLLLCRRSGRPVAPVVSGRVRRMFEFQVELAGPDCVTLGYGNGTEDPLFPLDSEEGYATAGLRELYRSIFCPRLSAAPHSADSIERAFWLLGGEIVPDSHDSPRSIGVRSWRNSGFHLFPEPRSPARLVFRTGPGLADDLMSGHMHADLLSVYATSGAQPFLVDAGTWTYRVRTAQAAAPGRRYFAGPLSHNTLSIDSVDPLGTLRGDFRDGALQVRVRRRRFAAGNHVEWVECEVVGQSPYAGYRRGVVHVEGHYWMLYDRLPSVMPERSVQLRFQTPPSVRCRLTAHDFAIVEGSDDRFWIAKGSTLTRVDVASGELEPPGGWVSPRYGELLPASQLSYTLDGSRSSACLVFGFGGEGAFPVEVEEFGGCLAIRCRRTASTDLLLLGTEREPIRLTVEGSQRSAELLWSRRSGTEVEWRLAASRAADARGGTARPDSADGHRVPGIGVQPLSAKPGSGSDLAIALGGKEWQRQLE